LRFPDSSIETKLGDTSSSLAASLPVRPAFCITWRSPSPSSRLRIVGSRCGIGDTSRRPILNSEITKYAQDREVHHW